MTKVFCDRCGKEIVDYNEREHLNRYFYDNENRDADVDLCRKCSDKLDRFLCELKNEEKRGFLE